MKTRPLTFICSLTLLLTLGACSLEDDNESLDEIEEEILSLPNATTPNEFIDKAYQVGNYSLALTVDLLTSDFMSAEDVYNGNYSYVDLIDNASYYQYVYDIYYTDEAFLVDQYALGTTYLQSMLLINSSTGGIDTLYWFNSTSKDVWNYAGILSGHWQDFYGSLFDLYLYGVDESSFSLIRDSGDNQIYGVTNELAYLLCYCIGADLWYSDIDYHASNFLNFTSLVYYPEVEEMDIIYYESVFWFDNTYTYAYLGEDDLTAHFYDIGSTNIDDKVESAMATLG